MKNSKYFIQFTLLAGLFILLSLACSEKSWNDYYVKPDYLKEGSALNFLASNPAYSEFSNLLKKTGNDSLLIQGGSYTVFAVKNGSFSGIDTTRDMVVLKKLIGMHVLPVTVFKEMMNEAYYSSMSEKLLRFSTVSGVSKVNTIPITNSGTRVMNGIVYEAASLILPLPNIVDYLNTDPSYTYWKNLISSSYTSVIDPALNTRTGYDSLGLPVYKPPYVYKMTSSYLNAVNLDKENILSTMFVPSPVAMNDFYASMLAARNGDKSLIIPKVKAMHGDTTIGGYFIERNDEYIGDTAVFLNFMNNNVIAKGDISSFVTGSNSFQSVSGNPISVNKNDVVNNAAKYASNGYIYTVNKLNLPEIAFRRPFSFLASPSLRNYANILVPNPNFTANFSYRKGFSPTITVAANGFATFNFNMINAEMDLIFPYVTKGNYNLSIQLSNPGSNPPTLQGYFETYYNSVMIARFTNNTINSNNPNFKMFLSKLSVDQPGPVKITFRLIDLGNGLGANLIMKQLYLDPVNQ